MYSKILLKNTPKRNNFMKTRVKYILSLLLVSMVIADASGMQYIENGKIKLSKIVNDKKYNLNEPIEIKDSYQGKIVRKWYDSYSATSAYDRMNICSKAFVQWCNRFVGEKRDYVIFRTPFVEGETLKTPIGAQIGCYGKDSSEYRIRSNPDIIYDPFLKDMPLNNYIVEDDIIVSVSDGCLDNVNVVTIKALIPFEGKYYRYSKHYYFRQRLNFKNLNTKSVKEATKLISINLEFSPTFFFDDKGVCSQEFFYYFSKYSFYSVGNNIIEKAIINPSSEKITIEKLFY